MAGTMIASIVEGDGEVTALPVLLRRIAWELEIWDARFPEPQLRNRGSITAPGGIERFIETTAVRIPDARAILVLVDADDDCPAVMGTALLARARKARPDRHISVVLANREFEAWFLAAAPSLAGRRGLAEGLQLPAEPEKPRDCKGWLTAHRADGRSYSPTADQAALADAFDIPMARRHSPSFDKFCRDVERLLVDVTGRNRD